MRLNIIVTVLAVTAAMAMLAAPADAAAKKKHVVASPAARDLAGVYAGQDKG